MMRTSSTAPDLNELRKTTGYTKDALANPLLTITNFNLFECCPVDPSHTIWFGLIINILQLFRNRVFDTETRKAFDTRLLHYPWPRGVPKITFNIGQPKLKRWSMSIYRQIALVLPALFWKLVNESDFDLILDVMEIVEFFASPTYNLRSSLLVGQNALKTAEKLVLRFPYDSDFSANIKIPTLQMVLEYLVHDVPIFGHRPSECLSEEHKHQAVSIRTDNEQCTEPFTD
jgi:hypothetical protein